MHRLFLFVTLVFLGLIPTFWVHAQDQNPNQAEITSPTAGDALRGVAVIRGNTDLDDFTSWELTFGYANDTTGTWFFLAEGDEPFQDETLTQWDTTTITDGTYNLRLTIYLSEGRRDHFIVRDLRVRNYTPIETITPTPTLTHTPNTVTPLPSLTPTLTRVPTETAIPATPTPLPTNPVEISNRDLNNSLLRGAGVRQQGGALPLNIQGRLP